MFRNDNAVENIAHDRHAAVTGYLERFEILIRHNLYDRSWIFSLNAVGWTVNYTKIGDAHLNHVYFNYIWIMYTIITIL